MHKNTGVSTAHEIVELRFAVWAKVHDLGIKNGIIYAHAHGERLAERQKGSVRIPLARHQAHPAAFQKSQYAEAVILQLEQPVWVVEGRAQLRTNQQFLEAEEVRKRLIGYLQKHVVSGGVQGAYYENDLGVATLERRATIHKISSLWPFGLFATMT